MAASSSSEYILTECPADVPDEPDTSGVPGMLDTPDVLEVPDAPEDATEGASVQEVLEVELLLPCRGWGNEFFCRARMDSIFFRLLSTNSCAVA